MFLQNRKFVHSHVILLARFRFFFDGAEAGGFSGNAWEANVQRSFIFERALFLD